MAKRTYGSGSILKKENRKWVARFRFPDGTRKSKVFSKRSEAEAWITDLKADVQRGEYIEPTEITLREWLNEWLATYKQAVANRTLEYYQESLHRLPAELLAAPLQSLTPPIIQQAINDLQEGYAPRTVRMSFNTLKSALKKAVEVNLIRRNPADNITLPKQKTVQGGQAISNDLLAKIITWCKTPSDSNAEQAYKDMILFLARHGCRPGEARAIRTDKIKDGWIIIDSALDRKNNLKDTKTGESRRVPIALDCIDMINRRLEKSTNGWVFESTVGTPLNDAKLGSYIRQLTEGKHTPYDLRHTFCTRAVNGGGNLKAISAVTGHSIEMLLSVYTHVTDKDLKEIIIGHQLATKQYNSL